MLERAGQSLLGTAPFRRLSEQTRSIHIPRRIISPPSPANLVHRTRTLFNQLTAQLRGQTVPVSRFTHSSPSIRQSLSLPARIALSRPLRTPCLPKAPRIPGNVTHVGLGTARNFSTARPIFQNIVQNVPVAGRAFYEVDWDIKLREEKNSKVRRPKKANREVKSPSKLSALPEHKFTPTSSVTDGEVQHFFTSPSQPLVITYLQIPLAPTPTSRVPLSPYPSSPHLLPLSAIAKEHASHSKHGMRVSSLFRRLDAARVWERGASCETFGDPSGLCTILRIKFEGWTRDAVKEVLGDAGRDWCTIQELRSASEVNSEPPDSLLSPTRVVPSEPMEEMALLMPRLEFSASFTAGNSSSLSLSPASSSASLLSDGASDCSFPSISESGWEEDLIGDTSSRDASLSGTDLWTL